MKLLMDLQEAIDSPAWVRETTDYLGLLKRAQLRLFETTPRHNARKTLLEEYIETFEH